MKKYCIFLYLLLAALGVCSVQAEWKTLERGLDLGQFKVDSPNAIKQTQISILKIDPTLYELTLITQSELDSNNNKSYNKTAKRWGKEHNLLAVTNAGMFAQDYSKHVGYMRSKLHVNNSHVNQYQSVAAFDPKVKNIPPFQIFDLDHPNTDIKKIKRQYASIIQNLRLIKKPGINRWSQQKKRWSEAALGEDKDGKVLFIFSRAPFSMFDLNNILLKLDIDLVAAQHLEGGPEAQLYINTNEHEVEMTGSYETAFNENDDNAIAWPIPNIIGIKKKTNN